MSNNTKFTKGPWRIFTKIDSYIISGKIGFTGDDGEHVVVADCNDWLANEKIANAALIACAPEMYYLLNKLQIEVGLGIARHREIDRILAKARGEK
jgi:hypothetical protein